MPRILITTSHRPTKTTRRFVKILSLIIPDSINITRGKYAMTALTLQAIDIGAENIVIVRNRKGGPGYIDVYSVNIASLIPSKVCSIRICGYKIIENSRYRFNYHGIFFLESNLIKTYIDERLLACIFKCFNINISSRNACMDERTLEAHIESLSKDTAYELSFRDCKGNLKGLVLKICPVRTTR